MPGKIDHVVVAVGDLAAATDRFTRCYGLVRSGGGEHRQWGTENAVMPVGNGQYIELLAIKDASSPDPLVAMLNVMLADGDRTVALCIRPSDLDATTARLGLTASAGERHTDDGVLRWRLAGIEEMLGPARLPFFIDWQGAEGAMDAANDAVAPTRGIAWVEYGGDDDQLRAWVGDPELPLRPVGGDPGPRRIALVGTDGADVVVEAEG